MVYDNRVGVDRTDGLAFPENFTAVLASSELANDKPTRAMHYGLPIYCLFVAENIFFAMAETCSHFSGPLSEGKFVGGSIECPYHTSRFALEDGRVINGPAVHAQPCLEVRIREGQIEVRKRPSGNGH
jgi:nitrite reductase/ring-hydroxylating ferredoxin subunit